MVKYQRMSLCGLLISTGPMLILGGTLRMRMTITGT
jgi:hypothetical protein